MPKKALEVRPEPAGDWRQALSQYARDLALAATRRPGRSVRELDVAFPDVAEAGLGDQLAVVRSVIEQLALGVAAQGGKARKIEAALDQQLALVLEGIGPRLRRSVPANSAGPQDRPQFFQSRLWQLLHKVRESSELSYAREVDFAELDRRILFLLRNSGPQAPAGISAAMGVDKAQVSRSIRRLLEMELVERGQIRSPVALTPKGSDLAQRLLRMAELRSRELTFDVGDEELADFVGAVELLLDRAVQLYDQERELSGGRGQAETELRAFLGVEERRTGEKIVVDRARLVSPLLTLSSYHSRSGALSCKRLTGLSNFESWVLTEISYDPPTEWASLVDALQRDHSQAGRTVKSLIEKGLVHRTGRPGRRHGRFSPTDEGARLYSVVFDAGRKREEFLLAPLSGERLDRFMVTFEKVRRNATAQLERERAMRDLDGR